MKIWLLSQETNNFNNQPKCSQARWCQVLQSPGWCLEAGQHVVGGCNATALLLCPHYIRVSNDDGIQRWNHHPQTVSSVLFPSQSRHLHNRWPRNVWVWTRIVNGTAYKSNLFNEAGTTSMAPVIELRAGPPEMCSNECEEEKRKQNKRTIKAFKFMATVKFT